MSKIALVTGGSRGLGKDMAVRLAEKGIDVVVTYRERADAANEVVRQIESTGRKAAALQLDVDNVADFSAFVQQLATVLGQHWGRDKFDFLINNAGISHHGMIESETVEGFDRVVNNHFKGPYFLTQSCLPHIADGGRIINISTGLARFSMPGYSVYGSMKTAIETFTRYLAKELGPRRIAANVVAPGAIDTDFNRERFDSYPEMKTMLANSTALGRVGLASDIGGVVAFLCTDDAQWINGQRIEVTGGIFL